MNCLSLDLALGDEWTQGLVCSADGPHYKGRGESRTGGKLL